MKLEPEKPPRTNGIKARQNAASPTRQARASGAIFCAFLLVLAWRVGLAAVIASP
jgi:hypothetical protein